MNIKKLVEVLLADEPVDIEQLVDEASVHLPRRAKKWIASYDGNGKHIWQPTGETDRAAAQAIADEMEAQAKQEFVAKAKWPKKPTIRIKPGGPEHQAGLLSYREIAARWGVSERTVRKVEAEALRKLFNHPQLRAFWKEYTTGEAGEIAEALQPATTDWQLSPEELAILLVTARKPVELRAIKKLIAW